VVAHYIFCVSIVLLTVLL